MPEEEKEQTQEETQTEETPQEETQTNPEETQEDDSSQSEEESTPSSPQQDAKEGAEAEPEPKMPPEKNIQGEVSRRIREEIAPMIQQTVREVMQSTSNGTDQSQQPSQKKYTMEDLDYIEQNHPEYVQWAKNERIKLIKEEAKNEALQALKSESEKTQAQTRQQQALQQVAVDYPQLFDKSTNQWNQQDPLYQGAVQLYNSEKRLQDFGYEGFAVAVDRTFARMARDGTVKLQQQKNKLTAKERKLQKQSLGAMSGGTQAATSSASPKGSDKSKQLEKLMDEYKVTRSPDTFAKILKVKGGIF